jgi:glycerol-3-phosphate acyltransferase PlsY
MDGRIVSLMLLGYLVGSIPFAYLLVRRLSGVDLRSAGSGNVGASNAFRTSGRSIGVAAAALDVAKGSAVVLFAPRLGADLAVGTAMGVAAVLGHVYPVWLRFRGGKGVATACGVFVILAPLATAVAAIVFALTIWVSGYVSVASMVAAILLCPAAYLTGSPDVVLTGILLTAALVLYRHRSNLARLQAGTERRVRAALPVRRR